MKFSKNRIVSIFSFLFILAAIPFTILVLQKPQEIRQRAAGGHRTSSVSSQAVWQPPPNTTWEINYDLEDLTPETRLDLNLNVAVYFLDLFRTKDETITILHNRGIKVICYIDYGSWENDRPDAAEYPQAVLGNEYPDYPDERWVDIRSNLIKPILQRRMDLCKQRGFDGIVPDNLIGYLYDTGFDLTPEDQLTFDRWVFNEAHARSLSIGLLNDEDHILDVLPDIDWAMIEDCYPFNNCQKYTPVIQAGKAVFDIEYPENSDPPLTLDQFCPITQPLQISALLKHLYIDNYRETCSGPNPTSTPIQTPSPTTVPSTSSLTLHLKFQGINSQRSDDKIVAVLIKQGSTVIKPATDVTVTSDASGVYSGTVSGVTPGNTYDVYVKGPAHLQKKFSGITLVSGTNPGVGDFSSTPLLAGDVVAPNNTINIQDVSVIKGQFNHTVTSSNSIADLNNDGQINIQDVSLVKGNFGKIGD